MEKRGPVKLEVLRAKRALKNYQKAVAPLFLRAAELDDEAPATKAAMKALDEIAIELADKGELSYHVESIDRIAKEKGFETWKHLLEFSRREYSGLKETLAVGDSIPGKEAPLATK
jgi:hypothetical protein